MMRTAWIGWVLCVGLSMVRGEEAPVYKSPTEVAISSDGQFLYVANNTADTMSVVNTRTLAKEAEVAVGRGPAGLALSPDSRTLYVALMFDHAAAVVDTATRRLTGTIRCGYEPRGLALSPNGRWLYTANHISDDVSVIDTQQGQEVRRIAVGRAPTCLALSPDGKYLWVNHLLAGQPGTDPNQTTFVSMVDIDTGQIHKRSSPGNMLLNQGVAVSRDGRYAFSAHARPNFNFTTSQLHQGWVHTNALTVVPVDLAGQVVTVLLDNVSSGAANPHGVAVSKDGKHLLVGHHGTHQISVIDLDRLFALFASSSTEVLAKAYFNLGFLWKTGDIVRRVSCGGLGPKGMAVSPVDGTIYVANSFSDQVAVLDPATFEVKAKIDLGGPAEMTLERKGEFLFNDGAHCFQQWVSCASCHPDCRADSVNWDLLNDGMKNPKNAKSLILAWATPPSMSLGVRTSMEVAAEKGFLFIQFVQPTQPDLDAVRTYLRAAPTIPSPWHRLADGSLDEQARRGERVFRDAGCASCHPQPLYTDLKMYDVGTQAERDFPEHKKFDTPTLIEMYRTGPYLHDGRAVTLKEVLTVYNPEDSHGETSTLTEQEIDDLVAFLMSL